MQWFEFYNTHLSLSLLAVYIYTYISLSLLANTHQETLSMDEVHTSGTITIFFTGNQTFWICMFIYFITYLMYVRYDYFIY